MKRKLTLILSIVLVLTILTSVTLVFAEKITTSAKESYSEKCLEKAIKADKKIEKEEEKTAKKLKQKIDKYDIVSIMEQDGYYSDDIGITVEKLVEAIEFYNMTDDAIEYILSLVSLGYDLETLLDIYTFVARTNSDISIIRAIADTKPEEDEGDSQFWIENAYAFEKGITSNELSTNEIAEYVEKGIITEEILYVYDMSLMGNLKEREMLDMRVSGKGWNEIAALAYNQNEIANLYNSDSELFEIVSGVSIANWYNESIGEVAEKKNGKPVIKEKYKKKTEEKYDRANNVLDEYDYKSKVKKDAKENIDGIDDKVLDKLLENGYRIKEIKKAVEKTSQDKTSQEIRNKIEMLSGGE